MRSTLVLRLDANPLERVTADLLVVGVFEDERPLRRGAGRLDWRLCGWISQLVEEGSVCGEPGEAVLTPTHGRMRSPTALLLGLGPRGRYGLARAHAVTVDAVRRALALGADTLAMAPLGVPPEELSRTAESLVSGALEVLRAEDATLEIRLTVPIEEIGAAARALEAVAGSEAGGDVAVLTPASSEPIPALARPDSPVGSPDSGPRRDGPPPISANRVR